MPFSTFERKRVEDLRFLAVSRVLAGGVFAAILAARGDIREAAAFVLAPLLYLAAVLTAPLRNLWLQIGLRALIPVALGFLLGYPIVGALIGVGLALLMALGVVRGMRTIDWDTIRPLEPTAVDPEAARHVFQSGLGTGPLDDTHPTRGRIDDWLTAASPAL